MALAGAGRGGGPAGGPARAGGGGAGPGPGGGGRGAAGPGAGLRPGRLPGVCGGAGRPGPARRAPGRAGGGAAGGDDPHAGVRGRARDLAGGRADPDRRARPVLRRRGDVAVGLGGAAGRGHRRRDAGPVRPAGRPAPARAGEATRLGARRVAGVHALGLRIVPRSADTTVARVDLWADPASGLPVRVELTAKGGSRPILTTAFLDLRLGAPDPAHVRFALPDDADVESDPAPDLARAIDRFSPFVLPDPLDGRPRRTTVGSAASTYGRGFDLVAVLAFPANLSPRTRAFLDKVPVRKGPWGEASVLVTPLLNGMVFEHNGVAYALAGTVTQPVLDRVAATLARDGVGLR